MDCGVCSPLTNLKEVWEWSDRCSNIWIVKPLQQSTSFAVAGISCCNSSNKELLVHPRFERTSVPRTLFCHDMKGGYLEDRFVDGCDKHESYRFFHWTGIDIFIYFSHKLVTIPPPCWIEAAHLHGVKVLGTFITEWGDGNEICGKILESKETIDKFVEKLVSICKHYQFDGWLLNIENEIPEEAVGNLELLVSELTKRMHSAISHSEVIWYDSVIKSGELKWQNELNNNNRKFFDGCDGIFLNYTWKPENLLNSLKNAGPRFLDVFVGIDVFGRGCLGGGGFNTCEALEAVRSYNLSAAIFGAGWVHECLEQDKFQINECKFWRKLWPKLYIHGPTELPFVTSFCQGYGERLYNNGRVVSKVPWINLRKQQHQPSVSSCLQFKTDAKEKACNQIGCFQNYIDDAFLGGGCLKLSRPSTVSLSEVFSLRILLCSFSCCFPLIVSFAYKAQKMDSGFNTVLLIEDAKGKYKKFTLGKVDSDIEDGVLSSVLSSNDVARLKEQYKVNSLISEAFEGWKLCHFLVENINGRILEVSMELGENSSVLLGWFSLCELMSKKA